MRSASRRTFEKRKDQWRFYRGPRQFYENITTGRGLGRPRIAPAVLAPPAGRSPIRRGHDRGSPRFATAGGVCFLHT